MQRKYFKHTYFIKYTDGSNTYEKKDLKFDKENLLQHIYIYIYTDYVRNF